MENKMDAKSARIMVWENLRKVARPDSKFGWDFNDFIPDYEGSDKMADLLRRDENYKNADVIFVTPDNNLEVFREYCIKDGKTMLITSYGIKRGIFVIEPGDVPSGKEELASVLDGAGRFWKHITLDEIVEKYGKIDMLITGASAITPTGMRFGKGHGYFDVEWAMFWEHGLVSLDTPTFAAVHDGQGVDVNLDVQPYDTAFDFISTPTKIYPSTGEYKKPTAGIIWSLLDPVLLNDVPPLQLMWHKIICK